MELASRLTASLIPAVALLTLASAAAWAGALLVIKRLAATDSATGKLPQRSNASSAES